MTDPLNRLLSLPRRSKQLLAMVTDVALCMLTVWLAICLRFESWVVLQDWQWLAVVASPLLAIPIFIRMGLYRAIFRYADHQTIQTIVRAFLAYTILFATVFTVISFPLVPRTIGVIQPILLLVAVSASRLIAQRALQPKHAPSERAALKSEPALVFGTGLPAQQLAASLKLHADIRVVGFVDDDSQLVGGQIQGLNVYATSELQQVCDEHGIRHVLLAKPELTRSQRNGVLQLLAPLQVSIRTLPTVDQWVKSASPSQAGQLRDLDIEDLLGRDPVAPVQELLVRNVQQRCVLITGAGGSIGSELARQVLALGARKLVLFDSSEYALYRIGETLQQHKQQHALATELASFLGNCSAPDDLQRCFAQHQPETVFHAAAYKHVPLVERNVEAGIRNNILGTHQAAQMAMRHGVQHFTLISTDKAVRPTNVMGATKRVAELCLHLAQQQATEQGHPTRYSMVRFGNVLGSSGSVVPKFRSQIASGGPVTLTHRDITRYFMTIPEAAQLVLQAAAMSHDGLGSQADTYLLDMGESVRIEDLARSMIRLSGQQVRQPGEQTSGIEIIFTGLRPGEKLYEELLISGESRPTIHPKIFKDASDSMPQRSALLALLDAIEAGATKTPGQWVSLLQALVPEFTPSPEHQAPDAHAAQAEGPGVRTPIAS